MSVFSTELFSPGTCVELLQGNPAGSINDLAGDIPPSLVIMNTHGLGGSGIYRWTVGSVTQRIVALLKLGHTIDLISYDLGEKLEMEGLRHLRSWKLPLVPLSVPATRTR